jgi:hypothetical protein
MCASLQILLLYGFSTAAEKTLRMVLDHSFALNSGRLLAVLIFHVLPTGRK